jgi:hypothetical protein
MPPLSVSAHRARGQVRIYRHDVDLRVPEEPVNDVLPRRPQPSLDDDAEFDADRGRH